MNEAWLAWANPPPRACVRVERGTPQALVEIVITATKSRGPS